MNNLVKHINVDKYKNVYVVGDIHGCYSLLMEKLNNLNFNRKEDLLISVGDLVDRANENEKCIGLINESWFECVQGNHEDFCVQGLLNDHVAFYHKIPNNGGEWFYKHEFETQKEIVDLFKTLPVMLEVERKGKKFGFVHADLPYEDWELCKECLLQGDKLDGRDFKDHLIWSRGIVEKGVPVSIAQIDNVFFGHTVLRMVTQLGNCTFLDTGGVFSANDSVYDLSVIKLDDYV